MRYELITDRDRIKDAPQAAREMAGQAVTKTLYDIESGAKRRAPVDTGFLRNSIHATFVGDVSGEVIVGAEYGIDVEMGTRRMAGRPYLGPAVEESRPGFEAAMAQILDPSSWGTG